MDKHLLVTLGSDMGSSYSLRTIRAFFANREAVRLTLLYVAPKSAGGGAVRPGTPCPIGGALPGPVPGEIDSAEVSACGHALSQGGIEPGVECPACRGALDAGRRWLVDMGFPPENVSVRLVANRRGTVGDIVHEARAGLYDAVVLGRRGLSWFEEMFEDSVSHRIMWEALDFPIWVCREPDPERSGVLVCADGSEQSERVADHVGFMLRDEPRHKAVIFHIETGGAGGGREIVERSRSVLMAAGLEPERIQVKSVAAKDPVKAILAEACAGGYAAVAIGRRTDRPTALSRISGQVSLRLLRGLERSALWLCK